MDGKQITAEIIWRNRGSGELAREKVSGSEEEINQKIANTLSDLFDYSWFGFGDDGDSIEINYLEEE